MIILFLFLFSLKKSVIIALAVTCSLAPRQLTPDKDLVRVAFKVNDSHWVKYILNVKLVLLNDDWSFVLICVQKEYKIVERVVCRSCCAWIRSLKAAFESSMLNSNVSSSCVCVCIYIK